LNNGGLLPGIKNNHYNDLDHGFDNTLKVKLKLTAEDLSQNHN